VAEIVQFVVSFESSYTLTSLAILTGIGLILMGIFSFFSLPEPK